jgi:hypothetical protein
MALQLRAKLSGIYQKNKLIALWTLLSAVLLTLNLGYSIDMGANHPLQLIVVHKILNPQLYPNDAFVNQTWYAYTSVLWPLIAYLMQWFHLSFETISAILYIINRLLIAFVAIYVALSIYENKRLGLFGATLALLTFPNPFIGDGHPVRDNVEQTGFAFGLGVLSIFSLTKGYGLLSALTLGLCFCFNTMYAGFAVIYLIATSLYCPFLRQQWYRWLGWIGVGILIGLPGWLPTLLVGRQPYDVEAAWKVSEIAYPWHFYMVSGRANILFPLFLTITFILVRTNRFVSENYRNLIKLWTVIALLTYIFAHLAPFFVSPSLVRLHFIRAQDFWHFIAVIHSSGYLVLSIDEKIRKNAKHWSLKLLWKATLLGGTILLGVFPEVRRVAEGGGLYRYLLFRESSEVRPVAAWAQKNTATDDVFIIPIEMGNLWQHFRHLSQRNVYLHWKDGSGWTYAIWYAEEFLKRVRDIGFFEKNQIDESKWRKGDWIYRRRIYYLQRDFVISEADVKRVAEKYRIDYWITDINTPTSFPVVYQYGTTKVVKVTLHRKTSRYPPRSR